jgi:hypothetical protein
MSKYLPHDIIRNDILFEKCQTRDDYRVDLYRALCNNIWAFNDGYALWKAEYSWRASGAVVAEIHGEGDYIDYYCSDNEGEITAEIEQDLNSIGWFCVKRTE